MDDRVEVPRRHRLRQQSAQIFERAVRLHDQSGNSGHRFGVRGQQRDRVAARLRFPCDPRARTTRENVGQAADAIDGRLRVPGRDEDTHGLHSES